MTILYKLIFLLMINGEPNLITMQDELTEEVCSKQIEKLKGLMMLVNGYNNIKSRAEVFMKANEGEYFCVPQKVRG